MSCTANAQCDQGQTCGQAGTCCVVSGVGPWYPVASGKASDCCSGAVGSNGLRT